MPWSADRFTPPSRCAGQLQLVDDPTMPQRPLRVALACLARCRELKRLLTSTGIAVSAQTRPDDPRLIQLDTDQADVILMEVEQDDVDAPWFENLEAHARLPILLQDSTAPLPNSPKILYRKIAALARPGEGPQKLQRLWILGASTGGPQAIKAFLRHLSPDLPAAFILAQHIGAGFLEPLRKQLARSTALRVVTAKEGHVLKPGELIVAPVEKRLIIGPGGRLHLHPYPPDTPYKPSIDDLILQVAERYGPRGGAIIFSGMGEDGVRGCLALAARGGRVWIQTPESCLADALPRAVGKRVPPEVTGTPE
ncbi:MAG: chemotaxis protein CheB, partial [Gammaproteobacteria bacterium]